MAFLHYMKSYSWPFIKHIIIVSVLLCSHFNWNLFYILLYLFLIINLHSVDSKFDVSMWIQHSWLCNRLDFKQISLNLPLVNTHSDFLFPVFGSVICIRDWFKLNVLVSRVCIVDIIQEFIQRRHYVFELNLKDIHMELIC